MQLSFHTVEAGIADISPPRLEVGTEKLHALPHIKNLQLTSMQRKSELRRKERLNLGHQRPQPLLIRTHHIEVIYIPSIVAASEHTLHIVIQLAQINIAEKLARQVANGQATSLVLGLVFCLLRTGC